MNEVIHIGKSDISIKEYNGQRVVTFKDIDMVHGRPDGTARRNFSTNREHFIEGEDYFVLYPKDLENRGMYENRTSGITEVNPRGTAFITEQGYMMLVKSFTDDLAWDVQRQLVNGYFKVRQVVNEELSPQTQALMQLVNQIAVTELEQKKMKEHIEKIEQAQDAIKEAVQPVFDNWREEINKKFNRIQKSADKPFNLLRGEMYATLETRAGCDLKTRLRNKKQRMENEGCTKSEIRNINRMDIIEGDKKLREIFSKIVSEYEIRYCA